MSRKFSVLLAALAFWASSSSVARAANDDDYTLRSAQITFDTPARNDNKDHDTSVSVVVEALKGDNRTVIADKVNFAGNQEFKDPSVHSFDLDVKNKIKKGDINRLATKITIAPNGNDRWIFHYTLTLTFEKGDKTVTVTQKMNGIILDQKNKERVTETWVRFPADKLAYKLKTAKIVFITPAKNDNKDHDTAVDVELSCRLNEKITLRAASKSNFAGNMEFKDPSEHAFDLDLGTKITLEQYNKAALTISIRPNGNDRWVFDYRLLLQFEGDGQTFDVVENRQGIVLDQNNRTYRAE